MIFPKKIKCDICGLESIEKKYGDGWPGWGWVSGKQDDKGNMEFCLCPKDLDAVFLFMENFKKEKK